MAASAPAGRVAPSTYKEGHARSIRRKSRMLPRSPSIRQPPRRAAVQPRQIEVGLPPGWAQSEKNASDFASGAHAISPSWQCCSGLAAAVTRSLLVRSSSGATRISPSREPSIHASRLPSGEIATWPHGWQIPHRQYKQNCVYLAGEEQRVQAMAGGAGSNLQPRQRLAFSRVDLNGKQSDNLPMHQIRHLRKGLAEAIKKQLGLKVAKRDAMQYPVKLSKERRKSGGHVITFPDIPEAITQRRRRIEDARHHAIGRPGNGSGLLSRRLNARFPLPSKPKRGQHTDRATGQRCCQGTAC
jgi:hypothetical protein